MARSVPYQPFLLRLLHSIAAILAIGALATGFWVYNTYDGRFGRITLPNLPDIQGIHGTLALTFFIVFPALAIYSFHAGHRRLIQPDTLSNMTRLGQPIGWLSLQRIVNTLMLLAATGAVVTGRMMKEEWLPAGETDHIWYSLHLTAWLITLLSLLLHLLMSAKVGGVPLLRSMWQYQYRPEDSPALWGNHIRNWLSRRFDS